MTRNPFGPDELDRSDPSLDRVADRLERYAEGQSGEPPADLAARINAAVEAEPIPAMGWWASLMRRLPTAWRGPARVVAIAAVLAAAILGAFLVGEVAERVREQNIGTSPEPSGVTSPSVAPSRSPSPSPSPGATPPSPPASRSPTASDDDDDDEFETPEPSDDDSSGPGGGGDDDDNSGPGGGDDPDETPEPSDDDNSGPGGGDD